MNRILPGLYVGNYRDSKDLAQLDRHRITHILAITEAPRRFFPDREYLCIAASDNPSQNIWQYFPTCNDFIHGARLGNGNVLIHCLAGMSRSVTIAAAYLISAVDGLKWSDSLKIVRASRAVSNPNQGFVKQLQEYEETRLPDERKRLSEKFLHNEGIYESDRDYCSKALILFEKKYNKRDIYIESSTGLDNNFVQHSPGKYGKVRPASSSALQRSSNQESKSTGKRPTSSPSIRSSNSASSSPSSSPARHSQSQSPAKYSSRDRHNKENKVYTSSPPTTTSSSTTSSPLRQSTQSLPTNSPQHQQHHHHRSNPNRTTNIRHSGFSPVHSSSSPRHPTTQSPPQQHPPAYQTATTTVPLRSSRLTHSISHSQSSIPDGISPQHHHQQEQQQPSTWERHYGCWKNHLLNKTKFSSNPVLYRSNTSLKSADSLTSLNSIPNYSPGKSKVSPTTSSSMTDSPQRQAYVHTTSSSSSHQQIMSTSSIYHSRSPIHNIISSLSSSCPNSPNTRRKSHQEGGGGGGSLRHQGKGGMGRSLSIREEDITDLDEDEHLIIFQNEDLSMASSLIDDYHHHQPRHSSSQHHSRHSKSYYTPIVDRKMAGSPSPSHIPTPKQSSQSSRSYSSSSSHPPPQQCARKHGHPGNNASHQEINQKEPPPPISTAAGPVPPSTTTPSRSFFPTQLRTRWVMKRSPFRYSFN